MLLDIENTNQFNKSDVENCTISVSLEINVHRIKKIIRKILPNSTNNHINLSNDLQKIVFRFGHLHESCEY